MFLPDRIPAVASLDLARIEAAIFPDSSEIGYVKERLVMPRQTFDVETRLHVHQ
jgi:hypothetical protein